MLNLAYQNLNKNQLNKNLLFKSNKWIFLLKNKLINKEVDQGITRKRIKKIRKKIGKKRRRKNRKGKRRNQNIILKKVKAIVIAEAALKNITENHQRLNNSP